jgi:hypothetical protein
MLFGVDLARFRCVMRRMGTVTRGRMRMVRSFLMVPSFVVLGGFAMMRGRLFVMFGGVRVMLRSFVRHRLSSSMGPALMPTLEAARSP